MAAENARRNTIAGQFGMLEAFLIESIKAAATIQSQHLIFDDCKER